MKPDAPVLPEGPPEIHTLPDEDEHEDCLLSGLDLEGKDLQGREFRGCMLRKVNLANADLRTCRLDGLRIGLRDVQGMIVTPVQAIGLAALLGITVKE